ncbi:putative protein involved in cytokinesis, contains TGc (transglutaminase/protease-like) domain [Sedimentisphaera cyanobacteriorum]|uniref:Transglutaminase-like domain-containing protein n=1 Tax=Sedimentisphaera cyanobacteriorum TaxID=1940790 RepID=A0A1Q2HQZ4_9BACT|nr:transglutaminase-like domain-containing protein [Sedimentisphaera cyanobacteriorum]AQQ09810.1 putative protein involved in cytokinesis, contains TGc (transglutaminase/protease-like) domain [Sedimentisphaera cyanobacteriorum]
MKRLIIFLLVLSAVSFADAEKYYALFMNSGKSGYMLEKQTRSDGKITTENKIFMEMTRFGTTLSMETVIEYVETADFEPKEMSYELSMTGTTVRKHFTIRDGQVKIVTERGVFKDDWNEDILFPAGIEHKLSGAEISEGSEIEIMSFDPETVSPVRTVMKFGRKQDTKLLGVPRMLYKVQTSENYVAGGSTVNSVGWCDEKGQLYKTTVNMMGIELSFVRCSREFALSENESVDLLEQTLLESPCELESDDFQRPMVYTLKLNNDSSGIPSTGMQKSENLGENKYRVTVHPSPSQRRVKLSEAEREKYLSETDYVDYKSPEVQKLLDKIDMPEGELAKARKIEEFVHKYIDKKNLATAYARASETAVNKTGDCTEHSVLTAALCRAAGIPCKAAGGLVHTMQFFGENKFGFHAWNEAFAGGKWVGLDAAIGKNGFDSSHIKLVEGKGEIIDFFGIINGVEILECSRGDKPEGE